MVIKSPVEMRNNADRGLDIRFGRRYAGSALRPGARVPLEFLVTAGLLGDGELQVRPPHSSLASAGYPVDTVVSY